MKILFAALAIALAGCGHVTTDAEDAYAACGGINGPYRDMCMANYVNTARAGRDAQWSAIGAGMTSRPAATSCMNIGGIITCR